MFVIWYLSWLLSIPGVAITFTHASLKRFNLRIQAYHYTTLVAKYSWSWYFFLQRKSIDGDTENKMHNTAYQVKVSVIMQPIETPVTFGYKALKWLENTGPWIDCHSSSAVTLSTRFQLLKVAPLGGERGGSSKRPWVTSTFLRWDSPEFIFNNKRTSDIANAKKRL